MTSVPAAPNRAEITARVVRVEPSTRFPDKLELTIEILTARPIDGPDMVTKRIGTTIEAFTFEAPALEREVRISAAAEYLGDARQGQLQLSRILPSD